MGLRDLKFLHRLCVSFAVSITAGAFFATDTNTTVGLWMQRSLIISAILALSLLSLYTYRVLVRQRRYIVQGEDILDYEDCGFGEKDDPKDETGKIIVNLRPQWQLEGLMGRLGVSGSYLANIRFKRLRDVNKGTCQFTMHSGSQEIAAMPIDFTQLPFDQFVYVDTIFEYDGRSEIHFRVVPDEEAKLQEIMGFDRLEAYYLPKARILKR